MGKKRSITDEEISLIKAMASRKMKNKDIQFFFNRPDRAVNSGRITGIIGGSYGDSASIQAANDKKLDAFLKSFKATAVSAAVAVSGPGSLGSPESGPMAAEVLAAMFQKQASGKWLFKHGESDRHECKQDFGFKYTGKWLRAVAALANNAGGYIVFGVSDKKITDGEIDPDSYTVSGLSSSDFANADPAEFTKRIKATFDPTPKVEAAVLDLEGTSVGVMYVHQHGSRPIIAQKGDGDQVKEGDIFFRYPGQSARIKYSDLRTILDERDRQSREQILPMVEKLLQLGPRNAMVADLTAGILSDENRSIVIGEELLEKINFIREGEFDEKKGEPTLKLVGEVQPIDGAGGMVRKAFVTPADLLEEFLQLKSPYDPKEYIRCAIEGGNGSWLPMHYYARKAGLSTGELARFIMETKASPQRRQTYHDRAIGKINAFKKSGGQPEVFKAKLEGGTVPDLASPTDAANAGRAAAALTSRPPLELAQMLDWLGRAGEIIDGSNKPSWMSAIRRGLARIDELYFSEDGANSSES
jgi:hypothetical protein